MTSCGCPSSFLKVKHLLSVTEKIKHFRRASAGVLCSGQESKWEKWRSRGGWQVGRISAVIDQGDHLPIMLYTDVSTGGISRAALHLTIPVSSQHLLRLSSRRLYSHTENTQRSACAQGLTTRPNSNLKRMNFMKICPNRISPQENTCLI